MATAPEAAERNDLTADGVKIEPGLAIWNYNYDRDEVVRFDFEDNGKGWYATARGLFNGERMTTRHPATGEPA